MNNPKRYAVVLEGTSQILMHKNTPKDDSEVSKSGQSYEGEWKDTTYLNEAGNLMIPSYMLMAVFREGAKGLHRGKVYFTKNLYSSMRVEPFEVEISYKGKPINIEMVEKNDWVNRQMATIGNASILRERTAVPIGWQLTFDVLHLPNAAMTKKDIEETIKNASYKCGIGDQRPNAPKKPGSFGMFQLVSFK